MSYILDALKRADAERQRGHVPGLHTRSSPELDAKPSESARIDTRQRWVLLLLAALLAILLVSGALWWWLGTEPAETAPAALPASPAPSTQPEAASSPPTPAPAPAENTQTSEPATPPLPILAPAPARPPTAAREPDAAPADARRPADESASIGSTSGNAAAPASAAAPVRSFAELTPEARARLPAVNVSGVTYSKNAALRMLIINGKVVQEGDEFAPGLTLETIEQRSAVLNHQGLRYRIGY